MQNGRTPGRQQAECGKKMTKNKPILCEVIVIEQLRTGQYFFFRFSKFMPISLKGFYPAFFQAEDFMKKYSFLIVLFFIISVTGISAETPFFAINGKFKSYTKTNYVITQKFGDYFRTPDVNFTYNFDEKGKEIEVLEVSANGTLLGKTSNTYDEKDRLISTVSSDGANITEWRIAYTYNENDEVIDVSEFNKNELLRCRTITKYSEDKTKVDESSYDEKGQLLWKNIYKYDAVTGKKLELNQYFASGILDEKQTFIYNEEGILVEIDSSDIKGEITKKILYRFDESGKNTETTTYNFVTGEEEREFYRYDDNGNLSRVTTYSVSNKFDSIVNELIGMSEYKYEK